MTFSPTVLEPGHYVALAITNKEGVFELHTPFGGDTDNPGAVEGEYNVTISKTAPGTSAPASNAPPTAEEMSKMSARPVKGGKASEVASEIPIYYSNSSTTTFRVKVPSPNYDFDLVDKK